MPRKIIVDPGQDGAVAFVKAAETVFRSRVPITQVPLDVILVVERLASLA